MSRLILFLAMFITASAEADEPYLQEQLFSFISDVSVFEGQFYSVYDYCSPYAGEPVSSLSLVSWKTTNKQLLIDRDRVVEDLIRYNDLNNNDANNLRLAVKGFSDKARGNNRLYKDIINEPDKLLSCSKRLGSMNSSSMSFKSIAPASYKVWQRYHVESGGSIPIK